MSLSDLSKKEEFLVRVSQIIDKLLKEKEFEDLDEEKIQNFKRFVKDNISVEQFENISDEKLFEQIKRALVIELTYDLFKDLNKEQIEEFNSDIKRNDFF